RFEAGGTGRRFELALRRGIGRGIVVDKECRTADHHARWRRPKSLPGPSTQELKKRSDDLAEGIVLQLDLRRLRKKLGAEHALYCAQIAPGLAREIALKSLVAETGRIVVETEEQSCRHRRRVTLDRQQTRSRCVADANGGVRGAEIYAARKCHVRCFG